ncbi:50S ribosomal protein L3 N(5)-glutamine methyltransferase [Paenalcaligenes niemegkensis]|uniref:50S ribosomal protein L3 N(5)-glutamine methyltransferase n=1 Tax=Paenalcaligenes niemegkensis TaxID=2895469 RepID=UPI001EE8214D|nr:50S ribosomal protein L3 N(5)-glutamine methyltransferase [Paenalcaligenes niemegkensis]MCQ9616594.1 50S ribosomal protein L3 N(5)-glutamine methyltransferase [Paenalcaligenes niemegkensis]
MPSTSFQQECNSAVDELHTLRDLLRWTLSQFTAHELNFGHGSDNAWDEAVYLLLHSLRLPLDTLEPFLEAKTTRAEREAFVQLIARRCTERVPAAYITGEAWLQGFRFKVDKRCIVPRSPIAELLVKQLAPWIDDPEMIDSVLDLCTGTGCLAILSALAFENSLVDAVDLSKDALSLAQENIDEYKLTDRVTAIESDLYSALPDTQYRVIISNPPYVNEESMQSLPSEYGHEPRLALAGGDDGMDLVRRIIEGAPDFLAPDGILILEIGNEYHHFIEAFPDLDPVWLSTENAEDQILLLTREQLSRD